MPPFGAGSEVVDPPLPPQSILTLGYGDGGVAPFLFGLRDGEKKDIGFFKLFLTASPVDFSRILQDSPFNPYRQRGARLSPRLSVPEPWTSQLATVIQVDS